MNWTKFTLCFAILLPCALASCDSEPAPRRSAGMPGDDASQSPQSTSIPTVHLAPAFPRLTFQRPVFITHAPPAPNGSNRVFVVEQPGRILTFENRDTVEEAQVFLNIQPQVRMRHNEEGLLSLVFHPKYAENGHFFVYYSVSDPKRNRISRFTAPIRDLARGDSPGAKSVADPSSEQIILEVEQPWGNHNGSTLLFGPDGYLYASFGDGGAANDPQLNGQNLGTLLASVIRIDVDHKAPSDLAPGESPGANYAVPPDNPFVDRAGARPEIWAYGLRNVWRMSFDKQTGELWAGDVGQDAWEEIDLIAKGGNYGWNLREGKHPFPDGIRRLGSGFAPPDPPIDPVIDYDHRQGVSVTGGYVYRGQRNTRLQGVYVYADYGSRRIWGLRHENGRVVAHREMLAGAQSAYITSFGEDAAGELYACAFDQLDGRRGKIYLIVEN